MSDFNFSEIDHEDFRNLLDEIANCSMPFGLFGKEHYPPRGVPVYDLPLEYLVWFKQRSFPKGRLGELMAVVCEIKTHGMDSLFDPIRKLKGGRTKLKNRKK